MPLIAMMLRCVGYGPRKFRREAGFVEDIPIALEKSGLLTIEPQHVIALRRLQDAHQRLGMKAIRDDREGAHGPLKTVDLEEIRRCENCQAMQLTR
jgi:hypothetical protein